MPNRLGRPKGSIGKRTMQKIIEASQDVGKIERAGQKKATEVLNDLMQTAMSFAAAQQQKIMLSKAPGAEKLPQSEIDLFLRAMEAAGSFATALAPYQQPKFKALAVPPPANPVPDRKPGDGAKVINMADPNEVVRLYQKTIKRIA